VDTYEELLTLPSTRGEHALAVCIYKCVNMYECKCESMYACVCVCESRLYKCMCVCVCVRKRERVGVCLFTFTHTHIISDSWLPDNHGLLSNTKQVFRTHTVAVVFYIH